MGKYNFTDMVEWFNVGKRINLLTAIWIPIKFVYETQAIQRENSKQPERVVKESSSDKEHKVNALASGAEEGRDKLR